MFGPRGRTLGCYPIEPLSELVSKLLHHRGDCVKHAPSLSAGSEAQALAANSRGTSKRGVGLLESVELLECREKGLVHQFTRPHGLGRLSPSYLTDA